MQGDSNSVSYTNQDDYHSNQNLTAGQLSLETETIDGSPSYARCSEATSSTGDHRAMNLQCRDEVLPSRVDDTLIVPGNYTFKPSRILVPITSKLCQFFLVSGILYLLGGGLIISLETAIVMYSSSTFYRGFSIGCMMLTAGINLLMIAFSRSYSIVYIQRVLILVIICCLAGIPITVLDLFTTSSCANDKELPMCQKKIAQVLKLTMLATCATAGIYTAVLIAVVKWIRKKAIATEDLPGTDSTPS